MKTQPASQTRFALVACIAACAVMIGTPSRTLAADVRQPAPASSNAGAAPTGGTHPGAEERIKRLHDQLKITPAQEAEWHGVAQVMLDNASAVDSAIQNHAHKAQNTNAVDDLRSYQAIVEAHADGLKKLIAVFTPLYSAMPEAQRKNADAVFGRRTENLKLKSHG